MKGDNEMMSDDHGAATDTGQDAVSGIADAMALIRLALDPKALQAKLDGLMAATIKANEAKAAAMQAEAKLDAAKAEHAAREAKVAAGEAELEAVGQRWQERKAAQDARERHLSVDGQRRWLLEQIEHAKGNDERVRRRVVHLTGIRPNLNEALQLLPDWDAITAEIEGEGPDPHFDQRPDADATSDTESYDPLQAPETVPAGVTLTRTKPTRRGADRH